VWSRQRTDSDLVDPANTGLGHRPVQRWNLPEGWVISARPAHPAIISEADFVTVQDRDTRRGPGCLPGRCYQLAGLLKCGTCERLMESCWSNGKPAYRCRHGHRSDTRSDPARPRNAYIREDQVLARLPALAVLLSAPAGPSSGPQQGPGPSAIATGAGAAELISYLRATGLTLTYAPGDGTLRTGFSRRAAITLDRSYPRH